jgi:hypothetical protein
MFDIINIFKTVIAISMPFIITCHNGMENQNMHDIMAFEIKRLYNREFFLNLKIGVYALSCDSRNLLPDHGA